MDEVDAVLTHGEQSVLFGEGEIFLRRTVMSRGTQHDPEITGVVGGSQQQEPTDRRRQTGDSASVVGLEVAGQRQWCGGGLAEPIGRKGDQGQRVSLGCRLQCRACGAVEEPAVIE